MLGVLVFIGWIQKIKPVIVQAENQTLDIRCDIWWVEPSAETEIVKLADFDLHPCYCPYSSPYSSPCMFCVINLCNFLLIKKLWAHWPVGYIVSHKTKRNWGT